MLSEAREAPIVDGLEDDDSEKGNLYHSGNDSKENSTGGCFYLHEEEFFSNPMEILEKEALELAGLTKERAFAIDDANLSIKVGEFTTAKLMEIFYAKIHADTEDWFRPMFTSPIQDSAVNLGDYLLQRIGGPAYYSDRKRFPSLIERHRMFDISPRAAERWLEYMEQSMEELSGDISDRQRDMMMDHLRYTAFFLVAAQQSKMR